MSIQSKAIKSKLFQILLIFIFLIIFQSCAHYVANDYNQYLNNNKGRINLKQSDIEAYYYLTPDTAQHDYRFRSFSVGYAQLWVVNFGDMLENQLNSGDIQKAFKRLKKHSNSKNEKYVLLIFKLNHYEFSDYCAKVDLRIIAKENESDLIDKLYKANGRNQAGKMYAGGSFAMKNAIQQSTMFAINDILTEFINDLDKVKKNI
jgi:hypothetical protein